MKLSELLPSKLKWLQYLPTIIVDKFFSYLKGERRGWVILLMFFTIVSINFREPIIKFLTNFDPVAHQAFQSEKINNQLKHLLDGSHASRAYIFQFHNGVTFYTGQHAQRFSCTYEVVNPGVSREADNLQNLQVSVYSWWVSQTLRGDMQYVYTDSIPDYTTRYALKVQGIESIACLPLMDQGKVIGIVGIDYVGQPNRFLNGMVLQEWMDNEAKEITKLMTI